MQIRKIIPIFIFLFLFPVVSAHEAFTNLIGNIKVEITPNYLAPIVRQNFTASVEFTDLNSQQGLYLPYNVKIYNETDQIFEIDNLTTSATRISSFNYLFQKEGNYFIIIEIPSKGQADFPIFARTPNISGLIAVIIAGLAALIGYFVGRVDLLKPVEEEIEILEGRRKRKSKKS